MMEKEGERIVEGVGEGRRRSEKEGWKSKYE